LPDFVRSIEEFIAQVGDCINSWASLKMPWFRGQSRDLPLLPRLYRSSLIENNLVQAFRQRAPTMGNTPPRDNIDEWLFIMQHHGLPTRLLDWTEGALIALFFAIDKAEQIDQPVVWILNPNELNRISIGKPLFPLAWAGDGLLYVQAAFTGVEVASQFPAAIYPTNIHPRMSAQRSCFTIHGASKKSLEDILSGTSLIKANYLEKIAIEPNALQNLKEQLTVMGITESTLFPDLDGLARELSHQRQ
jgi:hypothetical protein